MTRDELVKKLMEIPSDYEVEVVSSDGKKYDSLTKPRQILKVFRSEYKPMIQILIEGDL